MTPNYIFVKADGRTHSVCNPSGLFHAIQLVRGQRPAHDASDAVSTNLEIVLQAAQKYYEILCYREDD